MGILISNKVNVHMKGDYFVKYTLVYLKLFLREMPSTQSTRNAWKVIFHIT